MGVELCKGDQGGKTNTVGKCWDEIGKERNGGYEGEVIGNCVGVKDGTVV